MADRESKVKSEKAQILNWQFHNCMWCDLLILFCCYSVAKTYPILCDPMDCSTTGSSVCHRLPEFSKIHVSWISDAIQPSHPLSHPFSSCPQSFPASWTFPVIWLLESYGQSTGASASTSFLPINIPGWFPLGSTGLVSLVSKGLSRVLSSTIIQKHQFFGAQPSSWSNSHICTWLLEKPQLWLYRPLLAKY